MLGTLKTKGAVSFAQGHEASDLESQMLLLSFQAVAQSPYLVLHPCLQISSVIMHALKLLSQQDVTTCLKLSMASEEFLEQSNYKMA